MSLKKHPRSSSAKPRQRSTSKRNPASILSSPAKRPSIADRLRKLNRTYALLSDVTQMIVRVRELQPLFETVCRIAVEQGGFRMAWIGLLDPHTKQVKPVAHAGVAEDYLDKLDIRLNDSERGRGPTAIAWRVGERVVVNDIETDPRMPAWRADALRIGYGALAVFPLNVKGETHGSLNLYATEVDFFDTEELKLLDEMTASIAFALELSEQETKRRQAEAHLAYQAHLLANVNDAIIATDAQQRITAWNRAAEELYGWKVDEVLGQPTQAVLRSEFTDAQRAEAIKILSGAGHIRVEVLQYHRTGQPIWVEGNTMALRDQAGHVTGFIAANRDITARKQMETALANNDKYFRALVEHSRDAIMVNTPDGIVLYLSPAVERITGIRAVVGEHVNPFVSIHPGDMELSRQTWDHIIHNAWASISTQFRIQHPNGAWRWLDVSFTNLTEEPSVGGIVTNFADITERKQAEMALHASERFARDTLDALSAHITILDETGKIVAVNRAWREFAKANHPQPNSVCEGANYLDICDSAKGADSEEATLMGRGLRAVIGGLQPEFNLEYPCHSPDKKRWFTAHITKFDSAGPVQVVVAHENITERKLAEVALDESEERLRLFIEHAPASLAMFDREMRYLAVSRRWLADYALEDQDIIGQSHYAIFPEIPDHWKIVHRRGLMGEVVKKDDDHFVRADGHSIQWLRWEVRPWRTVEGTIGGIVIFTEDITQRKRAEAQVAHLAHLIESVSDAIISTDINFVILSWNKAAEAIYGWQAAEVIGQPVNDIIPPAYPEAEPDQVLQEFQANGFWQGEVIQKRKDGTPLTLLSAVSFIRDKAGNPTGAVAVNHDITEYKRVEETLRLRGAALDATANAIFITNRDGIIEWGNPAYAALTGYSAAEFMGKNQRELVKSSQQDRAVYKQLWETILAGEVWRGELINRRKDGSLYHNELTITPLPNRRGEIAHFIAVNQDITQRKEAEQKIQLQLQRLQTLRAIDQIIASSFDVRLTLNMLLGHIMTQLNVDAAAILLLNPHLQTLEFAAGRGFHSPDIQHTRLRLGEGYAGRAALERQIVHIPNITEAGALLARTSLLKQETFIAYYGVPLIAKGSIKGVLEIFHRSMLNSDSEWLDFLETMAGQAAIAIDDAQLFEGLQRSNAELALAYDATIEGWSRAMDLRDRETEGHTQRVTELTEKLARAAGLSNEQLAQARRGALLHDMGKLGIPDSILLKPDKLTDEEWVIMRKHPQYAYDMLSSIQYLRPALEIPYCHHEKWDGTGYPRGLKGEQIPLAARLFAIADVWDALRSDRPYRAGWPLEKVLEYIRAQAGTHFDPKAVEIFFQVMNEKSEWA